jgi:hypothetical protein
MSRKDLRVSSTNIAPSAAHRLAGQLRRTVEAVLALAGAPGDEALRGNAQFELALLRETVAVVQPRVSMASLPADERLSIH